MKLLLFSDLHTDTSAATRIVGLAEGADVVLGAGDYDCPVGAVLVSHSPPKDYLDLSSSGSSLGSTAVREAVLRLKPRLVVPKAGLPHTLIHVMDGFE